MSDPQAQGFVLSPQQKALWALEQSGGLSCVQVSVSIQGPLQEERLQQAIQTIMARHEILRTTFHCPAGLRFPLQVITEQGRPALRRIEPGGGERGPEREALIARVEREDRCTPFAFSAGPLVRVSWLVQSATEHLLILTLPALCADACSLRQLVREIGQASAPGLSAEAEEEEPLQYADYAAWQEEILCGEDAATGRAYWQTLAAEQLAPVLPLEGRPSARGGCCDHMQSAPLDAAIWAQVRDLSQRSGVSTTACLLAAWQAFLWRHGGPEELVVCSANDGRKYSELQGAIGVFRRWLPLCARFQRELSFLQLIQQGEERLHEASAWQEYWSREISLSSDPEADDLSIGFAYTQGCPPWQAGDLLLNIERQLDATEACKLSLDCREDEHTLQLTLCYRPDVYTEDTISRFLASLQVLLASAVQTPEQPVERLAVLGEAERQRLLAAGDGPRVPFAQDLCLHQLVEAQVGRTPDAPAILCGAETLSYRQLNEQANRLARHLLALGAQPGAPIGLCTERSPHLIVGQLAILKAGGVFVPLTPELPVARLAFMVQDTGIRLLLTHSAWRSHWSAYPGQIVCIDDVVLPADGENLPPLSTPAHPAYITYTSGSTGQPKGVLVPHRGVVSYFLTYLLPVCGLGPGDVVLQVAAPSFDAAVRDCLGPLVGGACVVLLPSFEAQNPATLLSAIREFQVSALLSIVPTLFHALLDVARPERDGRYLSLRTILLSGEHLPLSDCTRARGIFSPDLLIVNNYGPTETTFTATYYSMDGPQSGSTALVGRAIPNVQVCVLDRSLAPVPIGVSAEVYIGGVGVTYGYLNRPDLTAEVFLPNPLSTRPGERLYRSGDLAHWLPDGNLALVGRVDHLIKLRGIRLSPGEIEDALCQHPEVQAAVVVAREYRPTDWRLVAYIVAAQAATVTTEALRTFLVPRIPAACLPSAFVFLQAFPLTSNGKVNRDGLPSPAQFASGRQTAMVPPRSALERQVAEIWGQVLGVEEVGVSDDFFVMGGHSLLAARLIYQINETFQVQLPLRSLFDQPTVAALAQAIEAEECLPQDAYVEELLSSIEQLSAQEVRRQLSQEPHEPA